MLRRCPERARDFSPTCSEAKCGVNERTTGYLVCCILYRSFSTFLTGVGRNLTFPHIPPHFASLHVGLKSPVPLGRPRTTNCLLLTSIF
ncbi:hypothetical protein Barb4_01383 [Bacteroidales bacterium Barb4]|nr:hypothetical protein Barb4_01383 [Bacteroidales bacterium Barb4]